MLATLKLALVILISLIWLMRISRGLLGIVVGGIEGYIFLLLRTIELGI